MHANSRLAAGCVCYTARNEPCSQLTCVIAYIQVGNLRNVFHFVDERKATEGNERSAEESRLISHPQVLIQSAAGSPECTTRVIHPH